MATMLAARTVESREYVYGTFDVTLTRLNEDSGRVIWEHEPGMRVVVEDDDIFLRFADEYSLRIGTRGTTRQSYDSVVHALDGSSDEVIDFTDTYDTPIGVVPRYQYRLDGTVNEDTVSLDVREWREDRSDAKWMDASYRITVSIDDVPRLKEALTNAEETGATGAAEPRSEITRSMALAIGNSVRMALAVGGGDSSTPAQPDQTAEFYTLAASATIDALIAAGYTIIAPSSSFSMVIPVEVSAGDTKRLREIDELSQMRDRLNDLHRETSMWLSEPANGLNDVIKQVYDEISTRLIESLRAAMPNQS